METYSLKPLGYMNETLITSEENLSFEEKNKRNESFLTLWIPHVYFFKHISSWRNILKKHPADVFDCFC